MWVIGDSKTKTSKRTIITICKIQIFPLEAKLDTNLIWDSRKSLIVIIRFDKDQLNNETNPMVVQKGLITGKYFNFFEFYIQARKTFRTDSRAIKIICWFKRNVNRHIWASYHVSKAFFFHAKSKKKKTAKDSKQRN